RRTLSSTAWRGSPHSPGQITVTSYPASVRARASFWTRGSSSKRAFSSSISTRLRSFAPAASSGPVWLFCLVRSLVRAAAPATSPARSIIVRRRFRRPTTAPPLVVEPVPATSLVPEVPVSDQSPRSARSGFDGGPDGCQERASTAGVTSRWRQPLCPVHGSSWGSAVVRAVGAPGWTGVDPEPSPSTARGRPMADRCGAHDDIVDVDDRRARIEAAGVAVDTPRDPPTVIVRLDVRDVEQEGAVLPDHDLPGRILRPSQEDLEVNPLPHGQVLDVLVIRHLVDPVAQVDVHRETARAS